MNRADILDTAKTYVTKDRAATHGALEDTFGMIAASWSAKLGITITPAQVCLMLADLKICRAWGNPAHDDNWVDMAGYAACGGEIATGEGKLPLSSIPPNNLPPVKPGDRVTFAPEFRALDGVMNADGVIVPDGINPDWREESYCPKCQKFITHGHECAEPAPQPHNYPARYPDTPEAQRPSGDPLARSVKGTP